MPRDASGNYTLPLGNPVESGTIISSQWANPTMEDVGSELTNSLDRNGRGGMLVPFRNISGDIGAPGITFTDEITGGIYRAAAGDFRWAISGIDQIRIAADSSPAPGKNPLQIFNGTTFRNVLNDDYFGTVVFHDNVRIFPNNVAIQGNNATEDAFIDMIKVNAGNSVVIGEPNATTVRLNAPITAHAQLDFLSTIPNPVHDSSFRMFAEPGVAGHIQFFQLRMTAGLAGVRSLEINLVEP